MGGKGKGSKSDSVVNRGWEEEEDVRIRRMEGRRRVFRALSNEKDLQNATRTWAGKRLQKKGYRDMMIWGMEYVLTVEECDHRDAFASMTVGTSVRWYLRW